LSEGKIRHPSNKCENKKILILNEVNVHIYKEKIYTC